MITDAKLREIDNRMTNLNKLLLKVTDDSDKVLILNKLEQLNAEKLNELNDFIQGIVAEYYQVFKQKTRKLAEQFRPIIRGCGSDLLHVYFRNLRFDGIADTDNIFKHRPILAIEGVKQTKLEAVPVPVEKKLVEVN